MSRRFSLLVLVMLLLVTVLIVPIVAQGAITSEATIVGLDKGRFWHTGTVHWFDLTLTSPEPAVFIDEQFESSCGLTSLPGGFVSRELETVTFRWGVYLPENAHPGRCTITGSFWIWGSPAEIYETEYHFVVKK